MKRQRTLLLISLLALSTAPSGADQGSPSSRTTASQEKHKTFTNSTLDDRTDRDSYLQALELLLPDHCSSAIGAPWRSCIRIIPSFPEELEYSFSLEAAFDGTIRAQITRPKTASIRVQLSERKKGHPQASLGDITKFIELESIEGDQRKFPGLQQLAREFEKIRFSPVLSNGIMMDPAEYSFRVRSSSGENMLLTLYGPGSGAPVQPPGLIRWAESIKAILVTAFK